MKVGIDAFGCDHARSGLGAYLVYFILNLPKQKDITFELFGPEIDRYTYTPDTEINFVSVNIPDNPKKIAKWHKHKSQSFFKKQNYDVVLYPGFENICTINPKTKAVAIVNSPILLHENHKYRKLKKSLEKVTQIVVASNYVYENLTQNGISAYKIHVVQNGIDHKLFFQSLDFDSDYVEIKPFAIKKPYFIYGSRLSSSEKKHLQLIKAFELFKEHTNYPHRLVFSGEDGAFSEKVKNAAFESKYSSDIFITGYFPHTSIPRLYEGATACVFPAVNEGVGLPVIEAMACGIPVLCSDSGVLREVGGDVPLYFDPDNLEQMADTMQKIIEDEELYKEKVAQGLEWSKKFNWDTCINQTINIIKQL